MLHMADDKPQRSKASPPISPVRGGYARANPIRAIEAANWNLWACMSSGRLWQAVALAHNIEPDTLPVDWSDKKPFEDCPKAVKDDIQIACNHAENGKLKCLTRRLYSSVYNEVDLSDFAEWWALSLGRPLPDRFPRGSKTELDANPTGQLVQVQANDAETTDRTGLAGRPTSWHLIEAECRRRYAAKERHPGIGGESRADWADTLIDWLKAAHPHAPVPKVKTVTNKLAGLLHELETQQPPKIVDFRRPK
jgi:hypothetical protein